MEEFFYQIRPLWSKTIGFQIILPVIAPEINTTVHEKNYFPPNTQRNLAKDLSWLYWQSIYHILNEDKHQLLAVQDETKYLSPVRF